MRTKNFKLVQAIFESGLRNYELVDLFGLASESRLSRIINCRSKPTVDEIIKISTILKKSPTELGFEGVENEQN